MTAAAPPGDVDDENEAGLISVVMPSLNQGAFLGPAIESVLSQDADVELIVIDGGSSDESAEILRRLGPRLAYWQSQRDGGPAAAVNAGFRHARGEIFGVLNADDFYLPGALRAIATAFNAQPAVDVVSGHGYFASPSGDLGPPAFSDRWSVERFKRGACVLLQPSTFFRRSAFDRAGGFRESGRVCWDMELWRDLAATGARFHGIDEFIAAFRLHASSITGRDDLRDLRRTHAREVMREMTGGREIVTDRVWQCIYRGQKLLGHPIRPIRQRAYFYRVLGRWSL